MPADAAALGTARPYVRARGWDPASVRATRYAIGITAACAIALGAAWPMSFLTPVLVATFLGQPKGLTLKAGVAFFAMVAVACAASFGVTLLLDYPAAFFLSSVLGLFLIQDRSQAGMAPMLATWLTIALLLIPFLGVQSTLLALTVAQALLFGIAVAVLIAWLTCVAIPDPTEPGSGSAAKAVAAPPALPPADVRFRNALRSTLVVLPLFFYFHAAELLSDALILIFAGLLSGNPAFSQGFKGGSMMLLANALGGAVAIVLYNLLILAPSFAFLLLAIATVALIFGGRVFSGTKTAPLFASGMSTVLLIIGSVTTSTAEADAKVYTRLAQILFVVVYLVFANWLIDALWRRKVR